MVQKRNRKMKSITWAAPSEIHVLLRVRVRFKELDKKRNFDAYPDAYHFVVDDIQKEFGAAAGFFGPYWCALGAGMTVIIDMCLADHKKTTIDKIVKSLKKCIDLKNIEKGFIEIHDRGKQIDLMKDEKRPLKSKPVDRHLTSFPSSSNTSLNKKNPGPIQSP